MRLHDTGTNVILAILDGEGQTYTVLGYDALLRIAEWGLAHAIAGGAKPGPDPAG